MCANPRDDLADRLFDRLFSVQSDCKKSAHTLNMIRVFLQHHLRFFVPPSAFLRTPIRGVCSSTRFSSLATLTFQLVCLRRILRIESLRQELRKQLFFTFFFLHGRPRRSKGSSQSRSQFKHRHVVRRQPRPLSLLPSTHTHSQIRIDRDLAKNKRKFVPWKTKTMRLV